MIKNVPIELTPFICDYEKNPPVGIDLGTSNSSIAKWINTIKHIGTHVYTLNDQDGNLMPSVVYRDTDGDFLVGNAAYKKRISEPDRVCSAVKRRIHDASKNILLGDEYFSAEDVAAQIIKAIFKSCIDTGLENPSGVVVSVPYYFTQNQNHHVRNAVNQGIQQSFQFATLPSDKAPKLLGLIPEPVAAALSFAISNMESALDDYILLYDMGGGTLDITILHVIISGPNIKFEVLATDGDDTFGGEDFDHILENYVIANETISFDGLSEKLKKSQQSRIRAEIRAAKEKLSFERTVDLIIGNLPSGQIIDIKIKQSEFESMLCDNCNDKNYHEIFLQILDRTFKKTKISESSITKILPIGGSTQIPFFRKILENRFPKANFLHFQNNDTDSLYLSVARGASIYAAYLLDNQKKTQFLPSEKRIQIIQRTSHPLGILSNNGRFSVIVPANQQVPYRAEKIYEPTEYADESKERILSFDIEVYQGESQLIRDNTKIGTISLPDIYAHGRNKANIKISIEFRVEATNIDVTISIPGSNYDKSDIYIQKNIHLEERK